MSSQKFYRFEHGVVGIDLNGAAISFQDNRPAPSNQEEYISRSAEYKHVLQDIQDGKIEELIEQIAGADSQPA